MQTVCAFGIYAAFDTLYYLENGLNVTLPVEANPSLVHSARFRLAGYVIAGSLTLISCAISNDNGDVELTICGDDLGSSSVYSDSVASRSPLGTWRVPGITTEEIIERYVPFYLKVDIEGADKLTVLALSSRNKPQYLSFEISEQLEKLIDYVAAIGYCKFKIVDQLTFRELSNHSNLRGRCTRDIFRLLGYAEPQFSRRNGWYFKVGQSSGPAPRCRDDQCSSRADVLKHWTFSRTLCNSHA